MHRETRFFVSLNENFAVAQRTAISSGISRVHDTTGGPDIRIGISKGVFHTCACAKNAHAAYWCNLPYALIFASRGSENFHRLCRYMLQG